MVSKREIPSRQRESNPNHPIVQLVASRYTDSAIPAHGVTYAFHKVTYYSYEAEN
jgi:hypothetical protein